MGRRWNKVGRQGGEGREGGEGRVGEGGEGGEGGERGGCGECGERRAGVGPRKVTERTLQHRDPEVLGTAPPEFVSGLSDPRKTDVQADRRNRTRSKQGARVLPDESEHSHAARCEWRPRLCPDSDWAGDTDSRRSRRGCWVEYEGRLVAHWSSLQSNTALSPGEAELNAVVMGTGEGMAVVELCHEVFGNSLAMESWWIPVSVSCVGDGRVQHLSTKRRWVQ